jgi:type IX secretion system PorP/SprF family membrane protein
MRTENNPFRILSDSHMRSNLYTTPMKKLYAFLLFFFVTCLSVAQQMPHFSQYMLNDYAENPAIGGKNPYFEASSINRYQWIGINDAPRTHQLSVNGPLKNPHFGVGGQLFTDIVGPTRRTGAYVSYAYHATLSKDIKFSLGLQAGILQFMVDGSKINLHDQTDNVLSNGLQSVIVPDFGFGAYVHNKDKWYIGISALQITQNRLKFFDYSSNSLSKLSRHYYVTAGYKYTINDFFAIQPTTVVRFDDPVPVQFDLGMRIIYKSRIWAGGGFRNLDAWVASIGYLYKDNITIGYAFDFTTSNIKNYSSGSHEIFLALRFHHSNPDAVKP